MAKDEALKQQLAQSLQRLQQAEQKLQEMQTRFLEMMSGSSEAVLVVDEAGRILSANLAAESLFGRPAGELLGQELGLPLDPNQEGEVDILHPSGAPVVAEMRLLEGQWNYAPAWIVSLHNVTQRTHTEQVLRETEQRLDQMLGAMSEGMVMVDPEGQVTYYNRAAGRILGWDGEAGAGRGLHTDWGWIDEHNQPLQSEAHPLALALRQRRVLEEYEYRLRLADGSHKLLAVNAAPLIDSEGRLYGAVSSLRDITQRRRAEAALRDTEERLRYSALHDPLTHLPNRAYFMEHLQSALERAHLRRKQSDERRLAILALDLDRFKVINDSLGHPIGDTLLVGVARRLQDGLRPGDFVARLGGDEFAILVENFRQVDDLIHIARRILTDLTRPLRLESREVFTTASIGIAIATAEYSQPEDLLRDADTAMYQAKASGRSRYAVFHSEMHDRSVALLHMDASLRQALERNEFQVHYQPIVSVADGEITGVEALLRWRQPELGSIPPEEFIPLAEENGLIIPIGEWVLRQACTQARAWHDAGLKKLRVAVNVSSRQLDYQNFPELVEQILQETGLDPQYLELEITERVAMKDTEQTVAQLNQLNHTGVKISIDDFGNSYSSLGYLNRFPVHTLKIDRSFVKDISDDAEDAAIATAIILMAHGLKLKVIAEGVQNEKQLDFLTMQKCDEIQGYLIRPAVPAEAITHMLLGSQQVLWRSEE